MSRANAIVYCGREPFVQTDQLSGDARKQLWQAVQQREPDLADLLQHDEFFNALKERFDGHVVLPMAQYRELMKKQGNHEGTKGKAA